MNPLFANTAAAVAPAGEVDVSVFSQHHGYVNSLAFHPDGMEPRDVVDHRTCGKWGTG